MQLNFSDIPGHQNIFLDYLYEFENVNKYYKYNFRDIENYKNIFKSISQSQRAVKSGLRNILKSQYSGRNVSTKTKKNIGLFSKENTLAVVTGQQLGILGGPLYTFYKIITAIKLSNHLNKRYNEFNFVPVFWLEADDHDFNEVRSIRTINNNNDIIKIEYKDQIDHDDTKKSVGIIEIDDSINDFFNQLEAQLRDTEFKKPLLDSLKKIYSSEKTFKTSFVELLHSLFDSFGLVIFDPTDREVKEGLKPVFRKEIADFRKHTEKLVSVSAEMEEVYHAQVKINPVNLFFSTNDGRYAIEPVEGEFRLKRKRKSFTKEELMKLVDSEPERFSPNVLLRPICQDYILPTAFYIAGPSEIAYFAQVNPLYNFYEIQTPIIYPRSSATLVEANINKTLEKYQLSVNEIFMGVDELKKNVVESLSKNNVDEIFTNTMNDIEVAFDKLREKLFDLDKTIADNSNKYRSKIFNILNELKNKADQAQNKKYEVTLRQLERACNLLYPNSNLQEREINYTYFFNKYGEGFLQRIFTDLEIDIFEHQIISL